MNRRSALTSLAAMVTTGITGCIGGDDESTPTPTATSPAPSPTETEAGPSVEYRVRNDDNEPHPLEVVIENADGEVVHSLGDDEFVPGEQHGATSRGHDPAQGPYPITVSLESQSQTIEWKAEECPRFDLLVAVTLEGTLEVEREECIT